MKRTIFNLLSFHKRDSKHPARKKLFIHAGMFKTGTSSFQLAMYENRQQLAEAGIYYPETGLGLSTNHNKYAHRLIGINLTKGYKNLFPEIIDKLNETSNYSSALISYEGFCHPAAIKTLNPEICNFDAVEPHVIITLRPHLDYALSVYREACQHLGFAGSLRNILGTPNSARENHWNQTLNYTNILRPFARIFGPSHVHTFHYEAIKTNLTDALLSAIPEARKVSLHPPSSPRNPSISAPCAELMRRINREKLASKERHSLAYLLHEVDALLPHLNSYTEMSREEALTYEKNFWWDRRCVRKYGIPSKSLRLGKNWKWGTKTDLDPAVGEAKDCFLGILEEKGRHDLLKIVTEALNKPLKR